MKKIGSHVSFSNKGLLNAANEAVSYHSGTFMIYTGAPQNTRRKPIEEQFVEEGREVMRAHHIDEIIVHAPYIINLASYKSNTYQLAVDFLQEEMHRTDFLGVKQIVLHPGAFTDKDVDYGIDRIASGLEEVLAGTKETNVNIALETMAGKGTEIGRNFEEIAKIMEKVTNHERLTVCFDTCHIHDSGYDLVNDLDGVLHQFDQIIGLNKIAVVHLNDSKNAVGAGKDRHATLGSGYIGYEAMRRVVDHPALTHLPMILETPWIGKDKASQRPMYEMEIALLTDRVEERFGAELFEDVAKIDHFFKEQSLDSRDYILSVWDVLRSDAKARKADGREPMERLYDQIIEANLFEEYTEEQLNHRLTAWFANVIDQ